MKEVVALVWARFDDRYSESSKILEAGPWAELLDMRAIIYCARSETDGHVSVAALVRISTGIPAIKRKVTRLVEVGRWRVNEAGDGWVIHDFLDYNPSHASLEQQRTEGRERAKKSWQTRHSSPEANPKPSLEENLKQTLASDSLRLPRAGAHANGTGITTGSTSHGTPGEVRRCKRCDRLKGDGWSDCECPEFELVSDQQETGT